MPSSATALPESVVASDSPDRVQNLFHAALAHSPKSRQAFLKDACEGDRGLYDEVAHLIDLYGHVEAGEAGDERDELIDREVGPYRIVRLIGAGGMGRVYLARRSDGAFD